jgi:hypothetical protein
VLCIIAGEVKRRGICDLLIDKIGALAGVCRTTVQSTLHKARRLGHLKITERPQRGRKSLSNIVEVVSREWLAWLKKGATAILVDRVQNREFGEHHDDQKQERSRREGRFLVDMRGQ